MGIRLLVADCDPILLAGIGTYTSGTDIALIGSASSAQETILMIAKHAPDAVLLSVRLADTDRIAVLEEIRRSYPELPVVMLAVYDHMPRMARARNAGACGCLLKNFTREQFLGVVRRAALGQQTWSRKQTRRIAGVMTASLLEEGQEHPLTAREADVLRAVVLGYTNRRIAEELGISYDTVKEHLQQVLHKVGVSDRTQAAVWAVRHGVA